MKFTRWIAMAIFLLAWMAMPRIAEAQYPCSSTPNVGFQSPNVGNTTNWGSCLNFNFTVLDSLLGGTTNLPVATPSPSIAGATNWITNNTVPITLTNFVGGFTGQEIRLICGNSDTNTSVATSSNIKVSTTWTCSAATPSLTLVLNGSVWTEMGRGGGGGGGGGSSIFTQFQFGTATPIVGNGNFIQIAPASSLLIFAQTGAGTFLNPYVDTIGLHTQGNDSNLLTSGIVSGTAGSTFCTDLAGGATTVGCTNGLVTSVFGRTGPVTAINGDYTLAQITATFFAPLNLNGTTLSINNATTSSVGVIQLAGALGGTGTSPTVLQVNGVSYPTTGSLFDALPILTASNTIGYYQINGGSNCGDSTHGLSYNQTTHLIGCQSITGTGGGVQVTVNNGSTIGSPVNFQNGPATLGIVLNAENASGDNVDFFVSGALTDAGISSSYSGVGSCSIHTWASILTRNTAPTCTQPGFGDLTGTISLAQTQLTTTGDVWTVSSGSLVRLGQGSNGTFLGVQGGILGYYAPSLGSVSWSSITAPTTPLALTMPAGDTTAFTFATQASPSTTDFSWIAGADSGTSTTSIFSFIDTTGNTRTGPLLDIHTVGTSTALPVRITAQGVANGVSMSTTGLLSAIGSGGINATLLNSNTYPASAGFTSGGIPYYSSISAVSSSGLLTHFGVMFGGGAAGAPTSSAQGAANMPLIGQGASNPIFSTIAYPTSATSGGVICATSTTALASSSLLTANALLLGGGSATCPTTLGSLGTTTTVLHGNASGVPTFGSVVLTTDVNGTLPYGNGGTGGTSYTTNCILKAGTLAFGCSSISDNATLISTIEGVSIAPTSTTQIGLTVNNPTSTSVDIADFQVNGVTVAKIDNGGNIYAAIGSTVAGQTALQFGTAATVPSGGIGITVPTSGTAYQIDLPGTIGSATQVLQIASISGSTAVMQWGTGGGGSSAFPLTVSGTVTSGGIPYFNSTTQESSSGILNTNILVKGGGAGGAPTNSLATDSGTTLTYTGTGGISAPSVSTTGATAGYFECTQGSVNGHATSNTITTECPSSVTAYELVLPGIAATGISLLTNASNVVTESFLTSAANGDLLVGTGTTWAKLAGNTTTANCLGESSSGVASWVSCGSGGSSTLSAITAATGANTLSNGNNGLQIWNWAPTTNQNSFQFGETTAATSGTLGSQDLLSAKTLAGSTEVPLAVIDSLTGSQTLPALYITPTWNTSGVVDAGILENVTNTASGAASLLIDLQIGGTSQFKVDKGGNQTLVGNSTAASFIAAGSTSGYFLCTQGTDNGVGAANTITTECPTSVTAMELILPGTIGSANQVLQIASVSGGNKATLQWGTVSSGTPAFPVTITGGVSGAIPCFTSTTVESAGTLLAANAIVLGGGSGVCPSTNSAFTTNGTGTLTVGVAGTTTGIVTIASSTATGSVSLTPAPAASTFTLTLPAATDTVADLAGTQTFTNKSISLQQITSASGAVATFANGNNPLVFNFAQTTNTQSAVTIGETTAATGTSDIELNVQTLSGSTAFPLQVTARGTANGIQMSASTGTLSAIGTANINATQVNGNTFPSSLGLTSGGVLYASSASAVGVSSLLTSNAVVLGGGTGTAPSTVAGITTDGISILTLGVSGTSVGKLILDNATASASVTLTPPTGAIGAVVMTLPNATGTIVATASASTYTAGLQNFNSVTMDLPSSAAYAPTTASLFGYDSTNNRLVLGNGTNTSFPTWVTAVPTSGNIPSYSGVLGALSASGYAPQGTDTKLLTSGAVTSTAGLPICTDANFGATTAGCPTEPAVSNVTPVTVAANVTTDQTLQELAIPSGYLNTLNIPFLIQSKGYYSLTTGNPTLTFKAKLCAVSGCGSGTVVTIASMTTGASGTSAVNATWNLSLNSLTTVTGASGQGLVQGSLVVDLGTAISAADTVYNDTSTAAFSAIALNAATYIDFTVSTSSGSTSNSFTNLDSWIAPGAGAALASISCTYGTGGAFCAGEGTPSTPAAGQDILYGNSTDHTFLASVNGGSFYGVQINQLTTQSSTYAASVNDYTILCNGTFTTTLPTTGIAIGKVYRFKNIGSGTCTLSAGGAVNIDGATTYVTATKYTAIDVAWDGTQYWIF